MEIQRLQARQYSGICGMPKKVSEKVSAVRQSYRSSLTAAAKAGAENKSVIAVRKRCATQNL
jgi:hypothetical protein